MGWQDHESEGKYCMRRRTKKEMNALGTHSSHGTIYNLQLL